MSSMLVIARLRPFTVANVGMSRRSPLQRSLIVQSKPAFICRSSSEENKQPNTTEQPTIPVSTPDDEEPIWVRRERERDLMKKEGGGELPFGVYLIGSALVAIAAVGSIFEYVNKNPIFDIIEPDSLLYTPILGFFALTGLPSAGFLFYKAVSTANKEAERMDKLDGY